MTFISYSQNLEDVILWRALQHVDHGFYIDVGAWDPRDDSVTLAFYERGWRGINIEPDAEKHRALVIARPEDLNLAIAISDIAGQQVFYDVPGTGLSTLNARIADRHRAAGREVHERPVSVRTLREICAVHAPQNIHFLKIDVEGLEASVLASADFARFRPWIVIVEATEPNSPKPVHTSWEPSLLAAGYGFVYFDGLNRYYVALEKASEIESAFSCPPNVFDDYVSAAGIRKAIATQKAGLPVDELAHERNAAEQAAAGMVAAEKAAAEQAALQAAAEMVAAEKAAVASRAEALDRELQKALAARAEAELRALRAERDVKLAQADAEHSLSGGFPERREITAIGDAYDPEPLKPGRRRIHYDASLIVHFGLETPVGLVRTEHYVAEFLVRDPALDIRFVVYDAALGGYRDLTSDQATLLDRILFHRYRQTAPLPATARKSDAEPNVNVPLTLAHTPEPEAAVKNERVTARLLLRRLRTASTLSPPTFNQMLFHYAVRLLPVTPQQSLVRRLATRVTRRIGLHAVRSGYYLLYGMTTAVQNTLRAGRSILRPDPHTLRLATTPEPVISEPPEPERPTPSIAVASSLSPEPPSGTIRFSPGSVLLSMGNSWDYLDYAYLHRLCRYDGVHFVSVLFDVIAMQYPFSTPAPSHIYHRHWVEIGHISTHLLAISKFTADQYMKYIGEPNGLSPRISHAYLPSFLRERAAEIGEVPVPKLEDRSFVVFCSTIETRKNHQLLLQLWDRLRLEFGPNKLPVLLFVGKWGWGIETVRLMSERNYHLRNHLMILDCVSDAELIWLYRNARFTLFPALSEGYGLAAAESLSFGTPVVIANCPALIEATEGLMPAYDPLDFMAWLDEMRRLIRDDLRLDEIRAAAARYRGPAYESFADAIRNIALAAFVPETQTTRSEPCPAA